MGTSVAAVLLSRQAMHPCGSTPWVRQALAALEWIKGEGWPVVTSVGMPTWELLCAAAALRRIPQIVLIPAADHGAFLRLERKIREDFALDSASTCRPVIASRDREAVMQRRDETVLDLADIIIPVSLRPDGSMARRLKALPPGKSMVDRFAIPYETREDALKYRVDTGTLNPGLDELPGRYLIHWTRATHTCWPDERPVDYYGALIAAEHPLHSAFDTLHHIATTLRFIASGRHMPRDVRTVAFSGLAPRKVIPLMRWRARYREMSFEPYGLGIEWDAALAAGIRPVIYCEDREADQHPPEQRWRLQSVGIRTDWSQEDEYRHPGDLDFRGIPADRLLGFCRTPSEAGRFVTATGLPCMSIAALDPAAQSPVVDTLLRRD